MKSIEFVPLFTHQIEREAGDEGTASLQSSERIIQLNARLSFFLWSNLIVDLFANFPMKRNDPKTPTFQLPFLTFQVYFLSFQAVTFD